SAKVGDPLLIDVGVTNNGPDPALNVVFTLTIPAGASFTSFGSLVGFRPGDGCSNDFAGHISCHLASLGSGLSASLHNLSASAVSVGTLTLSNTTSSDTLDPDSANNTSTSETTIRALSTLSLHGALPISSAKVGDPLLIDVGVTN